MSRSCALCKISASLQCSGCHKVAYCGEEHQKEDWKKHKAFCRAFKVKSDENGDRYVVATRNIKEGTVILEEPVIVIGPSPADPEVASCVGCLRAIYSLTRDKACPRCNWPACNKQCPGLTDTALHAAECQLLTAVKSTIPIHSARALLPLRCLLLQKTNPKKWKVIREMAEHADQTKDPARNTIPTLGESKAFLEDAILKPLRAKAPHLLPPECSPESVNKIMSLICACNKRIKFPGTANLGGIYAVSGYFEHSCLQNTRISEVTSLRLTDAYTKIKLSESVVQTVKDIRKGERLTTVLIDATLGTFARQTGLRTIKNRRCFCERCLDPRELGTDLGTLKCGMCSGLLLPVSAMFFDQCDYKCHGSCGKTFSFKHASDIVENAALELARLKCQENISVQSIEEAVTKLEKSLHPHHCYCVKLKLMLIEKFKFKDAPEVRLLSNTKLHKYADMCRDVLRVMLSPCMIMLTNTQSADCLFAVSELNMEILRRKVVVGTLDLAQVNVIKNYCAELIVLGSHIAISEYSLSDIKKLQGNDVRLAPF